MSEASKSPTIAAISALAALITAAASLYPILREPVRSWIEVARPSETGTAQVTSESISRFNASGKMEDLEALLKMMDFKAPLMKELVAKSAAPEAEQYSDRR